MRHAKTALRCCQNHRCCRQLNYYQDWVLGNSIKSTRWALAKVIFPAMFLSSFMHNATVVEVLSPVITKWAGRVGVQPRVLLMPLSFSVMLGGMLTKIGTSVNLVVEAQAKEYASHVGSQEGGGGGHAAAQNAECGGASSFHQYFEFFSVGLAGLPCCLVGAIYLIIFAPSILGTKGAKADGHGDAEGDNLAVEAMQRFDAFTACARVGPSLIGKSLKSSGFDKLFKHSMRVQEIIHEDVEEADGEINIHRTLSTKIEQMTQKKLREVSRALSEDCETKDVVEEVVIPGLRAMDHTSSDPYGLHDGILRPGDILVLSGTANHLTEILRDTRLEVLGAHQAAKLPASFHKRKLAIAVVADGSRLHDVRVGDVDFRRYYHAAIIGIKRRGENLPPDSPTTAAPPRKSSGAESNDDDDADTKAMANYAEFSNVVLQKGDALLLEASDEFMGRFSNFHHHTWNYRDFVSVVSVSGDGTSLVKRHKPWHALFASLLLAAVVVLDITEWMPLSTASVFAVFCMLFTRMISQKKALSSVDGNSLLVIGAGFCLTEAFTSTNASKVIVNLLAGAHYSFVVDLFLLYIFTCALANLIHPACAVSLMFPIATALLEASSDLTWDAQHEQAVRTVLMIAGSSGFLAWHANHCNGIVAHTVGYTQKEFLKLGTPLLFAIMPVGVTMAYFVIGPLGGEVEHGGGMRTNSSAGVHG